MIGYCGLRYVLRILADATGDAPSAIDKSVQGGVLQGVMFHNSSKECYITVLPFVFACNSVSMAVLAKFEKFTLLDTTSMSLRSLYMDSYALATTKTRLMIRELWK